MKIKSRPKRHMKPSITFDTDRATFEDLLMDITPKVKSLSLLDGLRYYHQTFQSLFFNQEMSGSILLTLWNDSIHGYEDFYKAKKSTVFKETDLTLDLLQSLLIVYDPPLFCFTTHDPFKYLNKKQLDHKLVLFQKGLQHLFDCHFKPILYPF